MTTASIHQTKLYHITSKDFSLPLHSAGGPSSHYPAHDIPQLLWPDGTVCWLANLYLLSGYRKGRSRKNKGGTLLTWAKNLSPFIRWCFQNQIDFIDLTDGHFRMFVNTLMMEKSEKNPSERKRQEQQVIVICATVLNFLSFINDKVPSLGLIGPTGRIKAYQKEFQVKSKSGTLINRMSWWHDAIPRGRQSRKRQPISTSAVYRLYEASSSLEATPFVARRRYIMLRLLEITGGRRIEISLITVADINEAAKTGELKLFTAKQRRNDAHRFVPVSQADLRDISSYIKHYRHRIIRKTIGVAHDHGYLMISGEDGHPLEVDTLGSEFYLLRKAAGIDDEEACLQAFRHRFITNIFRDLIRTHQYQNPVELRNALLSIETLKLKVMEWTGHRNIESLEHYIHLAFEAESRFQTTLDLLRAKKIVDSLHVLLTDYSANLRKAKASSDVLHSLAEVVSAAAAELGVLLSAPEDTAGSGFQAT